MLQTAKDNRMSCCKLGEEILPNLIDIYHEHSKGSEIKNIVDLFLLQMVVHNPKGVKEDHPAAYAYSWAKWKCCLQDMYFSVVQQIENNLKSCVKNQKLFLKIGGFHLLADRFVVLFVQLFQQVRIA